VTHALQFGKYITDVGATALAAALKTNTCLRELVSAGGARGGGRGCRGCCDEGGCDLWLCY